MFLHDSLNKEKFNKNKKLNLLKKKYITITQFLSLLQSTDPYILIGSTLVDKDQKDTFINQWKNHTHNITSIQKQQKISNDEFIENLNNIVINFPQSKLLIQQFYTKLQTSTCKPCTKNRYFLLIAKIIKQHYNDGRQFLEKDNQIFKKIINKYFPFQNSKEQVGIQTSHYFDNTWIQPDTLINIGYDLIQGLTHCFQCTKKHIIRSKTLFNELILGYPNYAQMTFNELTQANKVIQECYVLYWDSIGQIDMASCELVGQVVQLPEKYRQEIIELANKIRIARIKFQQNINEIPDWNDLLISVQLLQNKVNKQVNHEN